MTPNSLLAAAALSVLAAASASAETFAYGTAKLPQTIEVVAQDGTTVSYGTALLEGKFHLRGDDEFSMGRTTRCDPVLGTLKADVTVKVDVESYDLGGSYGPDGYVPKPDPAKVGAAVITFPQGATVAGRCQNSTTNLTALTIFGKPFSVAWGAK